MFDGEEKIRRFINMQYVKMKNLAAVGSLVLLAINLAFTMYPYIEHRFPQYLFGFLPSAWIGVFSLFIIIVFAIWAFAHFYVKKMEMYRTEKRAEILLNPYAVYAFNPFQEMWFMHSSLPLMKTMLFLLPEGKEKEQMREEVDKVERWLKAGYIPKKDFPDELKKFYLTKKERRL